MVVAVLAVGCGKHVDTSGREPSSSFLATAKLRGLVFQLGADDTVAIDLTLVDKTGAPVKQLPGVVSIEVELDNGSNTMCRAVTSMEGNVLDDKGHTKLVTLATHANGSPCNKELLAAGFAGPVTWHIRASYMGSSTESAVKIDWFKPLATH